MWPAVPRIMGASSPSLLLPELQRAQRPAVGEMLGEELAKEALVSASRRLVERYLVPAGKEVTECAARIGGQHTARRCEPAAARAERATRWMAEHDRRVLGERRVAFRADVHRGTESQLGDDVPCAGQRRGERGFARRTRERVEREDDGVE